MTAFYSYTGSESRTPLIYRLVYDILSNAAPHTQQALTQLIDVIYAFLVDLLLHYSPDLIIKGVHFWAVWGLLIGRNEVWRLSHKSAIVSRALCAGALPVGIWNCATWVKVNGDYYREVLMKEKLLPCIKEISGDNFIFQLGSAPAHRSR